MSKKKVFGEDKSKDGSSVNSELQGQGFDRYKQKPKEPSQDEKIDRRNFLSYSVMGGLGVILSQIALPSTQVFAGVTDTPLSGTAAGGLPVAGPDLWFDGDSLGSAGTQITTWVNKGTLGTNFDLIYSSSLVSAGSIAATPVTAEVISGKKAAYFNGTGWPTLHFRGVVANQANSSAYYYFDGDGLTHANPLDRTIFWVYYYNSTGLAALGSYTQYTNASSVGFCYNNSYMVMERSDAFPTNGTTGLFTATTGQIAQAGHRQTTGNAISFWNNKSSSLNNSYTYTNGTTAPSAGSPTTSDSTVKLGGMGTARSMVGNGYTLELIVYGRALSNEEITSMRNYLGAKYGGTVNS